MSKIGDVVRAYCEVRGIEATDIMMDRYWNEAGHFMNALKNIGWQSPSDVEAACLAAQREAFTNAITALQKRRSIYANKADKSDAFAADTHTLRDIFTQAKEAMEWAVEDVRALSPSTGPWPRVPDGFVVVPVDPTHEMKSAGACRMTEQEGFTHIEMGIAAAVYRAMISEVKP